MVQVRVSDGVLEGEILQSDIGGTIYSFKGIPYAAPPVGELRFKAPTPPTPWEGVRCAKEFGSQCHQYNFFTKTQEEGSEDCLYLNVYTPDLKPSKPLPVMIWIHGGAFVSGNGNDDLYGPEFLVRHGVILVTLNYRLEVLGFLCLDTEDIPGNAGIKDQVAAMKWVKNNISNFGGDPDNITLFGQSSGGACVTYHCISPMTKGLFRRVIAQSGCGMGWWARSFRTRERSIALAKKLGCTSENDKDICEFFRKQPIKSLLNVTMPLTFAEKECDVIVLQFTVVSEKEFPGVEPYITGDIMEAFKNNIHDDVELFIGHNEHDGVINLAFSYDIMNTVYLANNFRQFFVPRHIAALLSPNDQLDIGKMFKEYYTQNKPLQVDNLAPIANFMTTELYKFSLLQLAKCFAHKNHKVYVYRFSCKSERNFFGKILGVQDYIKEKSLTSHSDEIPYLFPTKVINQHIDPSSETFGLINTVTKLWTNFAKTGNPTPDASIAPKWRPFKVEAQYYLDIGNKLARGVALDKEEIAFWENIFRKYHPSSIFTENEDKGSRSL